MTIEQLKLIEIPDHIVAEEGEANSSDFDAEAELQELLERDPSPEPPKKKKAFSMKMRADEEEDLIRKKKYEKLRVLVFAFYKR